MREARIYQQRDVPNEIFLLQEDSVTPNPARIKPMSGPPFQRDLLAGLLAIVAVLVVSIRAAIVGSDLRLVFAISMTAFFLAGLLHRSGPGSTWIRGLVTSSPGLLGTAALIVNDGLHRWPIPLMISVVSILSAVLGVQVRRDWKGSRVRSIVLAGTGFISVVIFALIIVPALVTYASVKNVMTATAQFTIRANTGDLVSSDMLQGRVVVLASWATWCLPCRWELPEIERAYERFQGNQDVAFFAVDRGSAQETPTRARIYLERSRILLPLAFEGAGFAQAFGDDALPMVVILDAQGRTRLVHHGYDASEHFDQIVGRTVDQLLAERGR